VGKQKLLRDVIWLVLWVALAGAFGCLQFLGYDLWAMPGGHGLSSILTIASSILAGYRLGVLAIRGTIKLQRGAPGEVDMLAGVLRVVAGIGVGAAILTLFGQLEYAPALYDAGDGPAAHHVRDRQAHLSRFSAQCPGGLCHSVHLFVSQGGAGVRSPRRGRRAAAHDGRSPRPDRGERARSSWPYGKRARDWRAGDPDPGRGVDAAGRTRPVRGSAVPSGCRTYARGGMQAIGVAQLAGDHQGREHTPLAEQSEEDQVSDRGKGTNHGQQSYQAGQAKRVDLFYQVDQEQQASQG
jgi:hypothetical protein